MKKIKLFFLAFLSVCLWLTSFSNAMNLTSSQVSYLDSVALATWSLRNAVLPILYEIPNPSSSDIRNLCVVFKNFSRTSDFAWTLRFQDTTNYQQNNLLYYATTSPYSLYCISWRRKTFYISVYNSSNKISADEYWVFDYSSLLWLTSFPSDYEHLSWQYSTLISDYNYCSSEMNNCRDSLIILSWSLSSCQSDLSDCRWWQDASLLACIDQKEQCESSLITLSWNYASLENMNTSLSSQLQECLENASNSTWDLICNKFDLFRSSDNTNYSFPINNDLILPPWYKWFVNEWVLAIKKDSSLDSSYSVSDDDFQKVINSYWVVLIYLFWCALFLIFLYMIRRYFIWLKS